MSPTRRRSGRSSARGPCGRRAACARHDEEMDQSPGRGEVAFIERLRRRIGPEPAGELWIGDDAAAVAGIPGRVLLAADAVVEGVHGDLSIVGADDLGWKAVTANVSDVAAMGGRPLHALCCVAAPPGTDLDLVLEGVLASARAHQVALVGGDLTVSACLVVAVSITGTTDGERAVTRSGARAGDDLWVTGPLGASAAGLRVLREGPARAAGPVEPASAPAASAPAAGAASSSDPGASAPAASEHPSDGQRRLAEQQPRTSAQLAAIAAHRRPRALVAAGHAARASGASSMIDVSDGLAIDLHRIATASGVGVALEELPLAPCASVAEALGGGEDYALVFSAAPGAVVVEEFLRAGLAEPLRIGRCVADPSVRTLRSERWEPVGYEHRF